MEALYEPRSIHLRHAVLNRIELIDVTNESGRFETAEPQQHSSQIYRNFHQFDASQIRGSSFQDEG